MDLRERSQGGAVRHPWEQARFRLIRHLVAPSSPAASAARRVLDVGSGDAWLAGQLALALPAGTTITCCDAFYDDAVLAELTHTGLPGVSYVSTLPAATYDLVLALDVVEHVDDHQAFVEALVQHTAPGGQVLVTVPAHQRLYGPHDVALGHVRRYDSAGLRSLLEGNGLEVVADGQVFNALLAVRAVQVAAARRRPAEDFDEADEYLSWSCSAGLAEALTKVLTAEGRAAIALARRGVRLPGLSCWALCRRP